MLYVKKGISYGTSGKFIFKQNNTLFSGKICETNTRGRERLKFVSHKSKSAFISGSGAPGSPVPVLIKESGPGVKTTSLKKQESKMKPANHDPDSKLTKGSYFTDRHTR